MIRIWKKSWANNLANVLIRKRFIIEKFFKLNIVVYLGL